MVRKYHGERSREKLDPVCEEFHDEFMMSRWHEPTVMLTRTSVLQDPYSQGPHNERARGNATRGRCESGARVQRRQGLPRTKAEETPLVPRTGQSNSAELVEKCPPTTRHKVRNAVTIAEFESEVADVRQTTAKRRLES